MIPLCPTLGKEVMLIRDDGRASFEEISRRRGFTGLDIDDSQPVPVRKQIKTMRHDKTEHKAAARQLLMDRPPRRRKKLCRSYFNGDHRCRSGRRPCLLCNLQPKGVLHEEDWRTASAGRSASGYDEDEPAPGHYSTTSALDSGHWPILLLGTIVHQHEKHISWNTYTNIRICRDFTGTDEILRPSTRGLQR